MKPNRNIIIFGATSAIAEEVAREYSGNPFYNTRFFLVARSNDKLQLMVRDLEIRGAKEISIAVADLDECEQHQQIINNGKSFFRGDIDIALIAQGVLPEQQKLDENVELAIKNFHTNAVSVISLMMYIAKTFEEQGFGRLAVIGSVAGDRARSSMTIYSAAKNAVARVAQGLSGRFYNTGISVTLIKPGYTVTPMTAHLKQTGFLWSSAGEVARLIVKAIDNKKVVVYTPFKWSIIMLIFMHLPSFIVNKLKV